MNIKIKNIIEKCKKIKGFEIICALVIAIIAICIYFSVAKVYASPDEQATISQSEDNITLGIKNILSKIQGVGECDVLVTYKNTQNQEDSTTNGTDNIQGVVVVAQGANDVLVRIKITNALCTLLNIEANNIQIFEKN